jgi:hypothetical protein
MAYFLISMAGDWQQWSDWNNVTKIIRLAILVVGGMVLYAGMLFASGLRWKHIYH